MAKAKQNKLITLDTETYNGLIGGLKRIAIFDGEKVSYGYDFVNDIEPLLLEMSKKYKLHIYIHNLEFDARKIPELFDSERIMWEKCFILNGKLATITCKKYVLHDSFRILPMPLSKLSHDFGVEHGKLNLLDEVLKIYPNVYEIYKDNGELDENKTLVNYLDKCDVDDPLFLKYLGYDVMSLYEIIEILMNISGLELKDFVKKISTSSLSRHIFKNGYRGKLFKQPLNSRTDYEMLCSYKWHDSLEIEEFIRCSYCGGRVEVFKNRLESDGFYNDVNSLYPFCMLNEYPIGIPEYYGKDNCPDSGLVAKEIFENWLETRQGLGFVSCTVFIPKQNIPPLPIKMGKLCFPTGVVYGTFTYIELEYAIKNCGVEILEYKEVCHFARTYPVFKNFIETMYQIKEDGARTKNEALRTFGKFLMNVGYGYTGMSRDKTQLRPIDEMWKHEGKVVHVDYDLGFCEVQADIKSEYIQVQVASYVTSYGRLVLLDALRQADKLGNVYYCDTDSVVSDVPLPDEMLDPYELGKWDVEAKPTKGIFLKPKVYSLVVEDKTKVKFKGISKETQKELSWDSYEMLYQELQDMKKDSVVIEKNKLLLRSIMYLEKNNIGLDTYETRDKKFNLTLADKRIMDYKNNTSTPLHFDTKEEFQNFSFQTKRRISLSDYR